MGTSNIYMLAMYQDTTTLNKYVPLVTKMSPLDFTVVLGTESYFTASTTTSIVQMIGRLAVCELDTENIVWMFVTGQFFFAQNVAGTSTSLQITHGLTSTMVISKTAALNLGATATPILIFDLYYKCTATLATNFLAIIYTSASKLLLLTLNNQRIQTTYTSREQ